MTTPNRSFQSEQSRTTQSSAPDGKTSEGLPAELKGDESQGTLLTKGFLNKLSTAREVQEPIMLPVTHKRIHKTADDFEIPYDPETDRNKPYDQWRRNRYLRCLITREIARHLDRATFLTVSFRELLIFSTFFLLLSIITFGSFPLEKFYLYEAMMSRYTQLKFDVGDSVWTDNYDEDEFHVDCLSINFQQINTIEHIWFYQSHIVRKILFQPFWSSIEGYFENMMIGLPRIRQLRVRKNTCTASEMMKLNMTPPCYGPYTYENEETGLISVMKHTLTERMSKIKEWEPPEATDTWPYMGELATYSGGGYVAMYEDKGAAVQLNAGLKSVLWYTRATRAIFIEFTIYNGNVNLFCIFKFIFEIPPTGGVLPTARIYVKKLIRYDSYFDFFILGLEIICMMFVVFFTIQKVLEISTLKMKLLKSFWNYVDLMVLIMAYSTFVANLLLYVEVQQKIPTILLPENRKKYISFDRSLFLHIAYSSCFATLIAFVFLRFLKYFNIVHSIYELHITVSRAIKDILCFFILFFYVYVIFALIGVFLFGNLMEDFKDFPMAAFALMRYSVADFNYNDLVKASPILGPVFYFTFMFSMVFILASVFLAILVSKYQEVRSEVSIGGAATFIGEMMLVWLLRFLTRMDCPFLLAQIEREEFEEKVKSPTEHVRYFLRTAGYSELEIELFFKKYEITDSKIEAMDVDRLSYTKGEREAPPPLDQKDIVRYIVIQKLDYLEKHYQTASKLINEFLNKLDKLERKMSIR